jgi:hypothetical protein
LFPNSQNTQVYCDNNYPGTVLFNHLCVTMVQVKDCADGCPYKGFKCRVKTQLGCGTDTSSVCMPDELSAQVACLVGHP